MDMWSSKKIKLKLKKDCSTNALGDLSPSHTHKHIYVCTHLCTQLEPLESLGKRIGNNCCESESFDQPEELNNLLSCFGSGGSQTKGWAGSGAMAGDSAWS